MINGVQDVSVTMPKEPSNKTNSSDDDAFANLLTNSMNHSSSKTTNNERIESHSSEVKNDRKESDQLDDLLSEMKAMFQQLPIAKGYLNPDLLKKADVQTLIASLPKHLQQLLTKWFSSKQPVEKLFGQKSQLNEPERWVAALLFIEQQKFTPSKDQWQAMSSQLKKVFPFLMKNSDQAMTLKGTLQNIQQFVHKQSDQNQSLSKLIDQGMKKESVKQIAIDTFNRHFVTETKPQKQRTLLDVFGQHSVPSLNKTFAIHLNGSNDQVKQQQFVKDFVQSVARGIFKQSANGMQQFTIKLYPEQLGQLSIELTQQNGEMVAKIMASTKQAKELIESELNQLKQTLAQQNITIDKIDVKAPIEQPIAQFKEQQEKQQENRRQEQKQTQQQKDEDTFLDSLEEILFQSEV